MKNYFYNNDVSKSAPVYLQHTFITISQIFITSGIALILLVAAMMWLMWSEHAAEFRRGSKLYPININLCCCLTACTLIYMQAVMVRQLTNI